MKCSVAEKLFSDIRDGEKKTKRNTMRKKKKISVNRLM